MVTTFKNPGSIYNNMEDTANIREELKAIKEDLEYIKKHIVDADCIISEDDRKAIEQARIEYKKGKTTPHAEVKKKLGL